MDSPACVAGVYLINFCIRDLPDTSCNPSNPAVQYSTYPRFNVRIPTNRALMKFITLGHSIYSIFTLYGEDVPGRSVRVLYVDIFASFAKSFRKLFRNLSGFDLNFVFKDYKCYNPASLTLQFRRTNIF